MKVLRRWSVLACVLLGILLTLNTIGWFTAKSVFKEVVAAGVRAELKEAVRVEVREALKELGVIHAQLKEIENDSILVSR